MRFNNENCGLRVVFLPRFIRLAQGFSYLEFVIVVAMISVLLGIAISRLLALQVEAERAALDNTVGALRSAIGIKVADYLAKGNLNALRSLEKSNPMDRLAEVPKNYLGEVDDTTTVVEEGNWYFDTRSRYLVYRVRSTSYFSSPLGPPARARFVVRLVYDDVNGNRVFDPGKDTVAGLQLAPVEPYTWTE